MSQQWHSDSEPYEARGGQVPASGAHGSPEPVQGAGAGLDPRVGGLLAYLLFGWIGGLVMFLTQKHPEVRFHGAQSILTSIAFVAVALALGILTGITALIPGVGFIGAALLSLLYPLLSLAGLALFVLLCVKGYNLEHYKLPVVGDLAERWAAS